MLWSKLLLTESHTTDEINPSSVLHIEEARHPCMRHHHGRKIWHDDAGFIPPWVIHSVYPFDWQFLGRCRNNTIGNQMKRQWWERERESSVAYRYAVSCFFFSSIKFDRIGQSPSANPQPPAFFVTTLYQAEHGRRFQTCRSMNEPHLLTRC